MGKFTIENCEIEGLKILTPTLWLDERGYFMETYNLRDYKESGIDTVFVQDNQSRSFRGVLRGLHFQMHHPQAKLIRVISGEIFDVVTDLRKGSDTFGKCYCLLLSSENQKQLFIPEGFAHGFLTLSKSAEIIYKCSDFYYPEDNSGIAWNDPDLSIPWPIQEDMELILSEKDRHLGSLKEYIRTERIC